MAEPNTAADAAIGSAFPQWEMVSSGPALPLVGSCLRSASLSVIADQVFRVKHVHLIKDLQLWRLRESKVESGLAEEAVDEAGPVL